MVTIKKIVINYEPVLILTGREIRTIDCLNVLEFLP